jgi:hypothetical protein
MTPGRTFPFTNLLRGRMAERILTILLERAAYRVKRFGIEELFDEVKYLDREQYKALDLPEQLRTIPDLLVTDPGVTWAKTLTLSPLPSVTSVGFEARPPQPNLLTVIDAIGGNTQSKRPYRGDRRLATCAVRHYSRH